MRPPPDSRPPPGRQALPMLVHPDDHLDDRARLPPLIQAMLAPEFYPHAVAEPLTVLQTHAAYVVLTGPHAYKVKKPVNLGFLDFSTLARRRFYCEEELRLNRRNTTDLYLAVLPIAEDAGGYRLGAERGTVVEYALQMRQFPQECLLSARFARDELTIAHANALGCQVACMHANAGTNPLIQSFGSVQAITRVIDENARTTQPYVGRDLAVDTFRQIQDFTADMLLRHGAWFRQRQVAGMIRECHGDLHLNNACLVDGVIQLFDCIEFNAAFRNIDVMYDAAFLLMDLAVRGRVDLAYEFLNAYLEQTNDYRGVLLLPLYVSMRAYIRAKVASLLSDDPHLTDERRAAIRQQAAGYYHYAWAITRPRTGRLIVAMGLSGSGKSTVARALARREGAIHLRSDVVRKHLAGVPLDARAPADAYAPAMGQACYARLVELGLLLATHGETVILDAKYDRRSERAAVLDQAAAAGVPARLLHCVAPEVVLRERVSQRRHDVSDASVAVLAQQHFEPLTDRERERAIVLDTTVPLDQILGSIPSGG